MPVLEIKIYFTTDGTEPTKESKEYIEGINISEKTNLKAVAMAEGWVDSDIKSSDYDFIK